MAKRTAKRAKKVSINPAPTEPATEQIAALAHALWQERGCPQGSPEVDWLTAERTFRPNLQTDPSVGATEDEVNIRETMPQSIDARGSKAEDIAGIHGEDEPSTAAVPLSLLRHRSRVPGAADLLD